MHFLIPITSVLMMILLALVSGRSIARQSDSSKNPPDPSKNVILLESPVDPGAGEKNFTLGNSLDEDWKKKSGPVNSEPFNLVVPVARNFSSLKELFDILREDSGKPPVAPSRSTNQSYVKGSEASDYVIFFTS